LNIIVCVKQVADPNIPPVRYTRSDGKRIVSPFGVPPSTATMRTRWKRHYGFAQHGGRVTAIGLGDDSSREALKRALAMGADAAVLLNDPAWLNADSAGVGRAIAAAISKVGAYDLVLCGRQASDTDGGQVLHWIAASLGLPSVSPVAKIVESDSQCVTMHRLTDDGYQRLRVRLPALLGLSSEANEPRHPSMRGTMTAGRTLIPGWKASDLGLAAIAPKVELRQLKIQLRASKPAHRGQPALQRSSVELREMGLI
jgi:electron transfer flavoprotein beta subunit